MIRLKILATVLLSVVILAILMYLVSMNVLLKSYLSIERTQIERNISRTESALKNVSDTLQVKLRDWAQWDDSYQFVQDGNSEYIEANLADETLINLEINLMAFVNNERQSVFVKLIDLQNDVEMPSTSLMEEVLRNDELFNEEWTTTHDVKILAFGDSLLLIEALPILPSSGEGPRMGTMFIGRFIDDTLIGQFEELTQFPIEILMSDDITGNDEFAFLNEEPLQKVTKNIKLDREDRALGFLRLTDIHGSLLGVLKIEMPREIYLEGKRSIKIFLLLSGGAILTLGALIMLLLELLLLSRFERLSAEMEEIDPSKDLSSARVSVGTRDELGIFAEKINGMLREIATAQEKEREATKLEQKAARELRRHLDETEELNRLMVGREVKMIEMARELDELKRIQSEQHKND